MDERRIRQLAGELGITGRFGVGVLRSEIVSLGQIHRDGATILRPGAVGGWVSDAQRDEQMAQFAQAAARNVIALNKLRRIEPVELAGRLLAAAKS